MHPYELKTHFKDDPKLRAAFIALSIQTFDLDFEPWFQAGGWDDTYQPFTYFDGDLAVANVSVSHMTLVLNGQPQKALQVGTVMTHPDYRRRGLAKSLFEAIFKVYPPNAYQYFLAADDDAVPLYELMGFKHWPESRYDLALKPLEDLSDTNAGTLVTPAILAPKAPLTAEALVELKKDQPLTDAVLQVIHDEAILKFYYAMGFNQFIYKVTDSYCDSGNLLGHALLQSNGTELRAFALYEKLSEMDLVKAAKQWGFKTLRLMYTPSTEQLELLKSENVRFVIDIDSNSQWMVHQGYADQAAPMPEWPSPARFPKVSQT